MNKFALTVLFSFVAPSAFAHDTFSTEYYVVRDPATKRCTIVDKKPTSATIIDDGISFRTRAEAEQGMKTMKVCTTEASDGLTTIPSSHGPKDTMNRLEAEVKAKGMTVFARIDHAAGAAAVGLSLRPTELLIFGNAKGGTPLMQSNPTVGIDLPLKALVWEDGSGTTWLSYNDPSWLAKRHGLGRDVEAAASAIAASLNAVTKAATTSP